MMTKVRRRHAPSTNMPAERRGHFFASRYRGYSGSNANDASTKGKSVLLPILATFPEGRTIHSSIPTQATAITIHNDGAPRRNHGLPPLSAVHCCCRHFVSASYIVDWKPAHVTRLFTPPTPPTIVAHSGASGPVRPHRPIAFPRLTFWISFTVLYSFLACVRNGVAHWSYLRIGLGGFGTPGGFPLFASTVCDPQIRGRLNRLEVRIEPACHTA